MERALLCLTLVLLAAVPDGRGPAPAPVAIPRQVLTYVELAEKLSRPGARVRCAASIADRAALVCLDERPLESLFAILGEGLDLRFRKERDGWLMEADPAVTAREADWRAKHAANIFADWQAVSRRFDGVQDQPLVPRKLRYDAVLAEYRRLSALPYSEANDAEMGRLGKELDALRPVSNPAEWLADRWLRSGFLGLQDVRDALAGKAVSKVLDAGSVLDACPPQVWNHGIPADTDTVLLRVLLDPVSLNVRAEIVFLSPMAKPEEYTALTTTWTMSLGGIFAGDTVPGNRWPGLGAEASAWIEADTARTDAYLAAPEAGVPAHLGNSTRLFSLSQLFEAWSAARSSDPDGHGGDIVMELAPLRESFRRDCANVEAVGGGQSAPPGLAFDLYALFRSRSSAVSRGLLPWSVYDREGVLIIKNRLSFVDRNLGLSAAELIRMERVAVPDPDLRIRKLGQLRVPFKAMREAQRSLGPWRASLLHESSADYYYRGVGTSECGTPIAIWDALPEALQRSCLASDTARKIDLPGLAITVRRDIDRALASAVPVDPALASRARRALLSRGTLTVDIRRSKQGETGWLDLAITNPTETGKEILWSGRVPALPSAGFARVDSPRRSAL